MKVNKNTIIAQAKAECGYVEGKNNDNAFGREYGMNNAPWCVIFIWHLFHAFGADELFFGGNKTALCSQLANYHKKQQVTNVEIMSGDIVFFNFSGGKTTEHAGICVGRNGNTIYTVEGNTSGAKGEGVWQKTRNIKNVVFAYRPEYAVETVKIDCPILKNGDQGVAVKALQAVIGVDVDGIFGANTKKALISWQKMYNLTPDGVCGEKTWESVMCN